MSDKITPKEVLVFYTGWLTTRRRATYFGATYEVAPVVDTLEEFEAFNPGWLAKDLTYPVPTYFSPSSRFYALEVKLVHLPWIKLKRTWATCVR